MRKTILPFLLLIGCAEPLVHQRALGQIHTKAAAVCHTKVLTCAALEPCSQAVRKALSAWQAVSEAVSRGADESVVTADALVSDGVARALCARQGVK